LIGCRLGGCRRWRLPLGEVDHVDIGGVHVVDADLVVCALKSLLVGQQLAIVADKGNAHRATAVVDNVVITRKHVLGKLDITGEVTVRKRGIGVGDCRFVCVILGLLFVFL
jgi:hypothetical protein